MICVKIFLREGEGRFINRKSLVIIVEHDVERWAGVTQIAFEVAVIGGGGKAVFEIAQLVSAYRCGRLPPLLRLSRPQISDNAYLPIK